MLWIKKYFIFIVIALTILPITVTAQDNMGQNQSVIKRNELNGKSPGSDTGDFLRPVLSITPREFNLGTIAPDEAGAGLFTLKNIGSGILNWSTNGPEGWITSEDAPLTGVVEEKADYLHIEIRLLPGESLLNDNKSNMILYNVEMKLEAENGKLICSKNLSAGTHKEAIKINSAGGSRTIFVTFSIVATKESALINLNPLRMDMGSISPGKTVSKKIRVTNKGKEMLTWSVALQKPKRGENPANFKKGRYISFINDEIQDSGIYVVPGHLKELIELMGKWTVNDGYPSVAEGESSIKLRFNGTGIILYLVTYPDDSKLTIYLDEQIISNHKWVSDLKERKGELPVAEGLVDGPHVLTIVSNDSRLVFEGAMTLGKNIIRMPVGRITVVPNSGTITSQTNYLNVTLNAGQMVPGYYGDNIIFNASGGDGMVEVFVEVIPDSAPRAIDIFRYSKGMDFLFTANPQAETEKISKNGYIKEGIAFRLFGPETPGATPFYRWYSPQKNDHFYHHDYAGGGKNLQGYIFEGALGNIATSKLTNTRELYRWYNPASGRYFYTTDPKAGNVRKNGYRFDGIAGYVK
ncbi:MAG: hypothetical protein ABSF79_12000 [Smithellaceae bacterium]|jgi:hypothetical protein